MVVLTNLRDEDVDELQPALRLLCARHLVLLASLKEQTLREVNQGSPTTLEKALEVATTHGYLAARRQAHEKIKGLGALVLDVEPDRLAIEVVNRYPRDQTRRPALGLHCLAHAWTNPPIDRQSLV